MNTSPVSMPPGLFAGRRYHAFSRFLRQRFGQKVARVTIDGGFTCPNVDGTVAKGGCSFCDNRSFNPNRRLPRKTVREQVLHGIAHQRERFAANKFLAYFQAATNTYAPVDKLRRLYDDALDHPDLVGLMIGTRPDCVPDPVLNLIAEYAQRHYVCVELGLQSIHTRSLAWMNRGHDADSFFDAVQRCQGQGFDVCVHLILGLPGESREDMLATVRAVASTPIQAVKLHNLHVVRDTPLAQEYQSGQVKMLERDEYVAVLCDALELLPPHVVLHRLYGDAPPKYLVAPTWCLDKAGFLQAVDVELQRRDSWQGKYWQPGVPPKVARQPISLVK